VIRIIKTEKETNRRKIMSQTFQMIMILTIPFLTGLILRLRGKHGSVAWMLSSLAIPVIILFDEFVLPYRGGGASMWPIALVFGGFYGTILGGLGALSASLYLKKISNTRPGP
jgi:hypothetical protein